jgi:hypothetical protein
MKHSVTAAGIVNGVICDSPAELEYVINNYTLPANWAVVSQGTKFLLAGTDPGGGGEIVTPEYQTFLDYVTNLYGLTPLDLPTPPVQTLQNKLFADWVDCGAWETFDAVWLFLTDAPSAFFMPTPIKNSANYIPIPGGVFPFTPYGVQAQGGTINDPAVLVKFTRDNAAYFMDTSLINQYGSLTGPVNPLIGFNAPPAAARGQITLPRDGSGNVNWSINDGVVATAPILPDTQPDFFVVVDRSLANHRDLFADGVIAATDATPSGGNATPLFQPTPVGNGSPLIFLSGYGGSLVAAGALTGFYDAWKSYRDAYLAIYPLS